MRDIRFRGQRLDYSKWVYGYLCPGSKINKTLFIVTYEQTWEVNPDTIGEYSGLKDKNGREIYEGDIVKHSIREPHEWSGLHEVKFDSGRFVLFGGNPRGIRCGEIFNYYPMNVEIIGNIYENPELIQK